MVKYLAVMPAYSSGMACDAMVGPEIERAEDSSF